MKRRMNPEGILPGIQKKFTWTTNLLCRPAAVLFCLLLLTGCGDTSPGESMNRAIAHAGKGEWDKAAEIADRTAERYPDLVAAHILRAVTSEHCGNRDNALDAARKAVTLDPESFEAQYTLGRLYAEDTARSSEAEQALLKAWKMRNQDLNVKILLCNVAMGANSLRANGYLGLLRNHAEFQDFAALNNQYAVTCVRRGDYKAASAYFYKAYRANRKNPELLLNIARFYDGCMRNKKSLALNAYREYLQIAGNDAAGKVEAAARISRLRRN